MERDLSRQKRELEQTKKERKIKKRRLELENEELQLKKRELEFEEEELAITEREWEIKIDEKRESTEDKDEDKVTFTSMKELRNPNEVAILKENQRAADDNFALSARPVRYPTLNPVPEPAMGMHSAKWKAIARKEMVNDRGRSRYRADLDGDGNCE